MSSSVGLKFSFVVDCDCNIESFLDLSSTMMYFSLTSSIFAFWSPVGDQQNFSFTMVSPWIDYVLCASRAYKSNKNINNITSKLELATIGGRVFWGP